MVPKKCDSFIDQLFEVVKSDGKLCLPNVKEITDPQEGLNLINRTTIQSRANVQTPYRFKLRDFDPPKANGQTMEMCWYPKIFINTKGMGGHFDGTGVILSDSRHDGIARVFTFAMCEHDWDQSGANHSRGWHPAICTKCGFDASIDSGD